MSDIAIRAENISKGYRIGQSTSDRRYKTLRDDVIAVFRRPFRRAQPDELFWALRDISLEIKTGEVLGVIGRNGAGKSTLLKIFSRITKPTSGYADIYGRVGSLIEVGTGFHPELTGRENIFLNGAVLGMTRREIARKFDEIVAFADVEKFLDTPAKRYSSGMYMRLAFAVAAHLEPEILLVDEVLAVGDLNFQKKSLGKMENVAKGGRTILFVSHQMNAIRRLCDHCIWLDGGQIRQYGATNEVIGAYESAAAASRDGMLRSEDVHTPARFLSWAIVDPEPEQPNMLATLGPLRFKMTVQINVRVSNATHGIALKDSNGQLMWGWAKYDFQLEPGLHEFIYELSGLPLRPGAYSWLVSLYADDKLLDVWHCIPDLIVSTEPLTHPRDEWAGILNIPCKFTLDGIKAS